MDSRLCIVVTDLSGTKMYSYTTSDMKYDLQIGSKGQMGSVQDSCHSGRSLHQTFPSYCS